MGNTVSFHIKIDDSGSFKTVTADADELGAAINSVKDSATKLKTDLVNVASLSQVFEGLSSAVNVLQGAFASLTASYREQKEADIKLETIMRNTMDATSDEIESVKEYIDAQERVGVVSGDVQTAAAQELATYLGLSSSLKTIIPTLNDMIVQQLGMNASATEATQIATMLGKVMNGQTKALSRYGYEFSEAQEYVLQFGDETERAAVLCEVIGQSVGGVSEATANTVIGHQKQMADMVGKVKEEIGGMIVAFEPWINGMASIGESVSGVVQLSGAIKVLAKTHLLAAANAKMQAAAQKLLARAGYAAAAGTTALKVATAALYATVTLGLSAAIGGLVALFTRLSQKGREAADGINEAADAEDAFASASMDMRLKLAEETVKLETLIKKKKATASAVKELNDTYGKVFGSHATAAEWYDILRSKSADYCRQLGYEAKAKVLAAQSGEKQVALDDLRKQISAMEESGPQARTITRTWNSYGSAKVNTRTETTDYGRLKDQEEALAKEVAEVTAQFEECVDAARTAADAVGAVDSALSEDAAKKAEKMAKEIKDYLRSVENAAASNSAFGSTVTDADARLAAMKSGLTSLIGKYGAEEESIRTLVAEYWKLVRARDAARGSVTGGEDLASSYSVDDFSTGLKKSRTLTAKAQVMNTPKIARPEATLTDMQKAVQIYRKLQEDLATASSDAAAGITKAMEALDQMYNITGKKGKMKGAVDTIDTLSAAMRGLSGAVGEAAGAWLEWGANLLQAIAAALPQLSTLFAANTAVAGSEAASSVASVPYVGPILAVAAIASILAAVASLPKFAAGGIAYGPTVGLFGEYAGASTNPEVVAPLDKLRGLLGTDTAGGSRKVRFEIEGRKLVGILDKEYSIMRRR